MPLKIAPATEADMVRSAEIEKRAYGPSESNAVFFPGEGMKTEDRIAIMITRKNEEPAFQMMKVVDTDLEAKGEDGIIACTLWFIWSGDLRPTKPKRTWGPGTNVEACDAFFGEMDRRWWAKFEGKPHVYLKLLHTDPDHQRRGAGSKCLEWGTAEADRLGLVSYLEASEDGRALYEKFGFKEVDRIIVDLSKWGASAQAKAYLMVREPVSN